MRVLVTGAGGQLGVDLVAHCREMGDDTIAADRSVLDITRPASIRSVLSDVRPDVVINSAAYTAVDDCETHRDHADLVNHLAVGRLAEAVADVGAHLTHISTDYVFDGTLDRPYREDDTPNPQSVYGATKLAGEVAAGPAATVVRTSWLCGEHGDNMVKLILRLASDGDRDLAFVDDQRGCPTFTADLAPAVRRLAIERSPGIHHLTNAGAVSWYGFVGDILHAAGHDRSRVRPIRTADLDPPRPAPRPANGVLDNAVWRAAGHEPLRHYAAPLASLIERLNG